LQGVPLACFNGAQSEGDVKRVMGQTVLGMCGVISLSMAGLGCDKPLPRPEPTVRSTKVVTLPAAPELSVTPYTARHSDGTLTVEGLLRERDKHIGTSVIVRGRVASAVKCAPIPQDLPTDAPPETPLPAPVIPDNCTPPQHLVLEDAGGNPKWKLTAYGSMKSQLGLASEGQEVTLTGDFNMISPDGVFLRQGGLLLLPDLAPPAPEPEPAPADEPATP